MIVLILKCLLLAVTAVGGAMALLPEIARVAVDQQAWTSHEDLARLASLAQAAPGPNMMIITVLGWRVYGVPGAIVATLAFCLPSALMITLLYPKWQSLKNSPWKTAMQTVLAALGVGMLVAGASFLSKITFDGIAYAVLTAGVAYASFSAGVKPVKLIASGALAGLCMSAFLIPASGLI